MSDTNKDVIEDLETSSEESTEENLEDTEAGETVDESKDVPYKRFSKVVEERNKLREEAEKLAKQQEELKKTLNPESEVKEKTPKSDSLSREDAILYAKGKTDEQVAYAAKVAELEGISKIEALENPLYVAWEEKQAVETANGAAQLGASNASAPHKEVTFTAGQSKDDHKALWEKLRQ